jgi:outer membrane protein
MPSDNGRLTPVKDAAALSGTPALDQAGPVVRHSKTEGDFLMKTTKALVIAATLMAGTSTAAVAEDAFQPKEAGHFMVNVRVTDVSPDAGNKIMASGVDTGLKANVGDSVVPTLGIAYFFTDNVAAELVLGTSEHNVKAVGGGANLSVYDTWVIPPVLDVQYHFMPKARFSPYVGAGVNYMIFYNGKNKNGFNTKLEDGFGGALVAGFDYALGGKLSLNVDVKKIFFNTKASINGGALTSSVDLDPWVVSAGLGYKF